MSQEKLCQSLLKKGFNKTSAVKISKKKYALQPEPEKSIDESVFTGKEDNSEYVDSLNTKAKELVESDARIDKQLKVSADNPSRNQIDENNLSEERLDWEENNSIHDEVKSTHSGDTTLDFENKAQPISKKTTSNQPDMPTKMEAAPAPAPAPAAPPAQPNYDIHTSLPERDEQSHRIKRKIVTEYELEPVKEPKQVTNELPKDKNDN
jgi:hypothetical protein